jgi:hypothetical protein
MTKQPSSEYLESLLQRAAARLPYPPTPNLASDSVRAGTIARRTRHARLRLRMGLLALALLAGLLIVPEVRARVLRIFQIGAMEIVPIEPTSATLNDLSKVSVTATAIPSDMLQGLAGETSLESARAQVRFPIRLPGYPADLGPPDRVYLQDLNGDALILVWLDAQQPERVRLSLYILTSDIFGNKSNVTLLEETTVNGQGAVWVSGSHLLRIITQSGEQQLLERRLVTGNVLIWDEGDLTYRLESEFTLQEAIRIAESLGN